MKETIEYLKKDRKVNDTFMKSFRKQDLKLIIHDVFIGIMQNAFGLEEAAYPCMKHTFLIMEIQSHQIIDIRMM